jgi:hypothetical protein
MMIDRKLYGRHVNTSPIRSSYWAVAESIDINPHVHCGWNFARLADIRTFISILNGGIWEQRFAPGGTHDIQILDTMKRHHGNGWAGYACKLLQTSDHVILSDTKVDIRQ